MRLNKTTTVNGKNISIYVSPELEQQAEWLIGVIGRMNQSGISLEDGERFQLGWSTLVFRKKGNDLLIVCEPDFKNNPFKDEVADVSNSLKYLSLQNEFAGRAGISPVITSFQDKILIEKECLTADKIYMSRTDPSPPKHDSGWFVGKQGMSQENSELESIYAFQLLHLRPELFPALILPPGFVVMVNNYGVDAVLNSDDEEVVLR